MARLSELKRQLKAIEELEQEVQDLVELETMAEEDESLLPEIERERTRVAQKLEGLELKALM